MKAYHDIDDSQLLNLLQQDDRLAFTEIYNRYWAKLLAIAYNHTKDKSAAEEIVQEVFISLWNRRLSVNIQAIDRYLATAVKFGVFKSYYRQNKRDAQLKNNLPFQESHQIDHIIAARFLQEYINGIVEQLPEKCRLVFKYSREAELTIPEIAQEMNIADKTVEAHLTKALKIIRGNLTESGATIIVLGTLITTH